MTIDTSNEALDALVVGLQSDKHAAHLAPNARKRVSDAAETIEALRRERERLQGKVLDLAHNAKELERMRLEGQTVTRERWNKAVDAVCNKRGFGPGDCLALAKALNLTIQDSEPGRECDCTEDYTETLGLHYWCPHRQESVSRRCTLKESDQ